jgi:hypothetical protein
MVLTTKEASYIIVLGIVISVLPISSTLLQDGYHIRFKQKTVNKEKRSQSNNVDLLETNVRNQSICFPTAFPMPFPCPIPITFP